jgi:uncharacterized phage-associated protein
LILISLQIIMYRAKQISDWILSKIDTEAGDTISPLKLQKLLYYCQAWHLTIFGDKLMNEDVEAWAHGPVFSSQYTRFAYIPRNEQIKPKTINLSIPEFSEESGELLQEVLRTYGEHSASYLEDLTHSEKPWIDARGGLQPYERSNKVISEKSMIDFYTKYKS